MKLGVRLVIATTVVLVGYGCSAGPPAPKTQGDANVMDIDAQGMTFEAPTSISAGWTTLRFHNQSGMTHFALVERLPDGVGVREQQKQVAPVFQAGMDLMNAGQSKAAAAKFGGLPEWFGRVVFSGGPGLTGPGQTSETTIRLEPGTYMLECYVKTNGVFHSFNPDTTTYGMVHQFEVTAPASPTPEPRADLRLLLSGADGIVMDGEPLAGRHVVAVHFVDQAVHENFVGHDVHLVRLSNGTDTRALVNWMDWRRKEGLETPAPAEFLGGVNEMPAGETAYMAVTLEPGRYAWIAEVPKADSLGFLKIFDVRGENVSQN